MKDLIERINILIGRLKLMVAEGNLPTDQGAKIFTTAKQWIGMDASPKDVAPDELGCAETVTAILNYAGFQTPVIVSTAKLYEYLSTKVEWMRVYTPIEGDIVISPTGMGGKNGIKNGHVGVVGTGGVIMSNASATGTFEPNYTINSWTNRYSIKGGYPIFYFRRVL